MVFCGTPKALTTQDLKQAKKYHRYINGKFSKEWWDGYQVIRWRATIVINLNPLWDCIMTPLWKIEGFNNMIQTLSKTEYHNSWFRRDRCSTHADSISIPKTASLVELQQLKSAIQVLSAHRSLEVVSKQLQRAHMFAILDRTPSTTSESFSSAVTPQPVQKLTYFRFFDLPPEIRKQILDIVLSTKLESDWQHQSHRDHVIFVDRTWRLSYDTSRGCSHSSIYPEVVRTCGQLLQEALPILHRKNHLKFSYERDPLQLGYDDFSEWFLSSISDKNIAMIEKVWLPGDPAVFPKGNSHPQWDTHMCLE